MIKQARRMLNRSKAKPLIIQTGFWYVDVPRTSSTSLKAELGVRFGEAYGKIKAEGNSSTPQLIDDHVTAQSMRAMLGKDAWDRIYTFSIVRNPWDRVASLFGYCNATSKIPTSWTFAEYVERLVSADDRSPYFRFHGLRYGATDFLTDDACTIIVDDVVKYENRAEELKAVAAKLGVSSLGETWINKSTNSTANYRHMYDSRTKNLVGDRYAADCQLFDYDF